MLCLDHLTVIAPTLAEGHTHLRDCLGLDIADGAVHREMGTHNVRLRLGDSAYLEVIAVDPEAPAPDGPRWFGLGDTAAVRAHWERGERLRAWVACSDDFDGHLRDHGALFGETLRLGEVARFSLRRDGRLPEEGILPCIIDRAGRNPPSVRMRDFGARLLDFVLEHPEPTRVRALYERIGIQDAPLVREGPCVRYHARIETPDGVKTLT